MRRVNVFIQDGNFVYTMGYLETEISEIFYYFLTSITRDDQSVSSN